MRRNRYVSSPFLSFFPSTPLERWWNDFESVIGDVLRARRHARSGVKGRKLSGRERLKLSFVVRFIITGKETLELGRSNVESFPRYKTTSISVFSFFLASFPPLGASPAKSSFKPRLEKPTVLSVFLKFHSSPCRP